jgi:hypothetical protein
MSENDDLFDGLKGRHRAFEEIRALFVELGGDVPAANLYDVAVARGILTDRLEAFQRQAGTAFCALALKQKDEDELPFAKPVTVEGERRWRQRELWTYANAVEVIQREADGILADHKELRRLQQWCRLKFGKAPRIPRIG